VGAPAAGELAERAARLDPQTGRDPGPQRGAGDQRDPAAPVLDARTICAATWRKRRPDGSCAVEPVRLLPDGRIWGFEHRNEASWTLEDGVLVLRDRDGNPSTRFESATAIPGGLRLEGPFVLRPADSIRHVLETIEMDWRGRPRPTDLTRHLLRDEARRHRWSIGDHTRGRPVVRGAGSAPLAIGRFTSIDEGVTLILGHRRADAVSTYPFPALHRFWPSAPSVTADPPTAGAISIGNDVWLGERTVVLPGVTVGDGAVVAPGSVLLQDVDPYAVVAGSPAQPVNRRFTDRQIADLLRARWWDWDDERIDALLPLMTEDVDLFLDAALRP
jgi:acetyltransferase-like isoleucine patch superfamily enzyme